MKRASTPLMRSTNTDGKIEFLLQKVTFVPVAADAPGQENVIEHSKKIQFDVCPFAYGDAGRPQENIEAEGGNQFGEYEHCTSRRKRKQGKVSVNLQQFFAFDTGEDKIKRCRSNSDFEKEFEVFVNSYFQMSGSYG